MKKQIIQALMISVLICGCATYEKRIQLSPQKTTGWKEVSPNTYLYKCDQGEVEVSPVVLGYASRGGFDFFIPIPVSKEQLKKDNEADAWFYIQFRSINPIDLHDLSYILLVDQSTGRRVTPKSSGDIINGKFEGRYTYACHYYFDLNKNSEGNYTLYISDKVFGCSIKPILFKHEKSFEFYPRQLM